MFSKRLNALPGLLRLAFGAGILGVLALVSIWSAALVLENRRETSPVTSTAGGVAVTALGGTPAPVFHLVDQFGRRGSLSQFRGQVAVLTFIDSRCTTTCPLTAEMLTQTKRLLGDLASRTKLVAVNANPRHTSVEDVRRWSARHGMLRRWTFFTGPPSELRGVWTAYFVTSSVAPSGEVSHIPAVYVIDKQGRERSVLVVDSARADIRAEASALAASVRSLLQA